MKRHPSLQSQVSGEDSSRKNSEENVPVMKNQKQNLQEHNLEPFEFEELVEMVSKRESELKA